MIPFPLLRFPRLMTIIGEERTERNVDQVVANIGAILLLISAARRVSGEFLRKTSRSTRRLVYGYYSWSAAALTYLVASVDTK